MEYFVWHYYGPKCSLAPNSGPENGVNILDQPVGPTLLTGLAKAETLS